MNMNTLGDDVLNRVFREARTYSTWLDKPALTILFVNSTIL